jgi:hypothetical protein
MRIPLRLSVTQPVDLVRQLLHLGDT